MSTRQLLLIAGAAVLVFWMLGAHNRLVALRNRIVLAWAQMDESLQRRAAAVAALLDGLRAHLPDESGALDAVAAAHKLLQNAADALRLRPAQAQRAAAWAAAEATLAAALARLLALLEQRPELGAAEDIAPHAAALRDASQRLAFARQLFNDGVGGYNDAVRVFPTNLVAALFGFGPAGKL